MRLISDELDAIEKISSAKYFDWGLSVSSLDYVVRGCHALLISILLFNFVVINFLCENYFPLFAYSAGLQNPFLGTNVILVYILFFMAGILLLLVLASSSIYGSYFIISLHILFVSGVVALYWPNLGVTSKIFIACDSLFSSSQTLQYAVYTNRVQYEFTVKMQTHSDDRARIRNKLNIISSLFQSLAKYLAICKLNAQTYNLTICSPMLHSVDFVFNPTKKPANCIHGLEEKDLLSILPRQWKYSIRLYLALLAITVSIQLIIFWSVFDPYHLIANSATWKTKDQSNIIFMCIIISHVLILLVSAATIHLHFKCVFLKIQQSLGWSNELHILEKQASTSMLGNNRFYLNFNEHDYLVELEELCYDYLIVQYVNERFENLVSNLIIQYLFSPTLQWKNREKSKNLHGRENIAVLIKKISYVVKD
ncbi:hypothetical protein RFI_22489 [Reticulomyxa filosa]|uniref:Uncharacterized protein n=1 Tax=Reticulomyxa filosa TaxID=46433 RepID=X6MM34_RETFI|nr:hypothetical protein RFI_22489 [Reticulomyxa filosa]|eukprot:ETO14879.1 hypothetical protein RFI_22489 [Reticulomyxa filosa]